MLTDLQAVQDMTIAESSRPYIRLEDAAIDLYQRGLNVIPIPRLPEVKAWAAINSSERDPYHDKPPYILKPFFTTRLHLCGQDCKNVDGKQKYCLPYEASFENLFHDANLAVVLGRTSGNLVQLDCDSQKAFEEIRNQLEKRIIPYWGYTSHRGGGYLVRILEGEVANIEDGKCSILDVQIWGSYRFAVLPPSLHPKGEFYQWIKTDPYYLPPDEKPPVISISELEWLGVKLRLKQRNNWERPETFGLPEWTGKLSLKNRKILTTTFHEGERNIQLTKPTYDIAALIILGEIPYAEGERVLIEAAKLSHYPASSIRQMLKSALRKNPSPARRMSSQTIKTWQKAGVFSQHYDWRIYGRKAQTARAVFNACIQRAMLDNSETFRASAREVAELANFGTHIRAWKGLQLLCSSTSGGAPALLNYAGKSDFSGANLYSFTNFVLTFTANKPSDHNDNSNYPLAVNSVIVMFAPTTCNPISEVEKDVFVKLGLVAWRVWRHLCSTPESSAVAIAKSENLVAVSVRRALKALKQHGLVTFGKAEGLYYGEDLSESDFESIATKLGTLGKSALRKRNYQIERERRANLRLAKERKKWHERLVKSQKNKQSGNALPNL